MKTSIGKKPQILTKSNSIQDLQFKLEVEELKSNLFNDTTRYKNSTGFNFNKTSRQLNPQIDSICNYSKMDENNEKFNKTNREDSLKNIIRKMFDVKKSNHILGQDILNRKKIISSKEKIILQLYEDLRYHLNENSRLGLELDSSKKLSSEWESSRNSIIEYCNDLKIKFYDFVKIIEEFENRITELKKEKEQIIRINESIIEMKINECRQIELEILNLNKRISFNDDLIMDLNNKIENSLKEKDRLKIHYSEVDKFAKIKFDELNKNYRQLSLNVREFKWKEEVIETEFFSNRDSARDKEKEKQNLEIILKEHLIKNEFLRNEYTDLTMRLSQMERFTEEQNFKNENRYGLSFNKTMTNRTNSTSSCFQTTRPNTLTTKNFISGSFKTLGTK